MKGAICYVAIATVIFSHVKITCYFPTLSSFRAKAHLVFHWCSYNKNDDNEFDYNDDYSDEDGDDDNKYSDSERRFTVLTLHFREKVNTQKKFRPRLRESITLRKCQVHMLE